MGVEYSTSIAWGHKVGEKTLSKTIPGWQDDCWSAIHSFCEENYPLLEFIEAGNNWSGSALWVLVISSTLEDISQESGVFKFKTPTEEERLQFSEAYARLTNKTSEPEAIAVGHIY